MRDEGCGSEAGFWECGLPLHVISVVGKERLNWEEIVDARLDAPMTDAVMMRSAKPGSEKFHWVETLRQTEDLLEKVSLTSGLDYGGSFAKAKANTNVAGFRYAAKKKNK